MTEALDTPIEDGQSSSPTDALSDVLRLAEISPIQKHRLLSLLATTDYKNGALHYILNAENLNTSRLFESNDVSQIITRYNLFDKNGSSAEKELIFAVATYHGFFTYCIIDNKEAIETLSHITGKNRHIFEDNKINIGESDLENTRSKINNETLKIAQEYIENPNLTFLDGRLINFEEVVTAIAYLKVKKAIQTTAEQIIDVELRDLDQTKFYDK